MFKTIMTLIAGTAIGFAAGYFFVNRNLKPIVPLTTLDKDTQQTKIKFPIKATLYRFEINDGKMNKFNEWMKWHYVEHAAILTTLEREQMYFESIFRDTLNHEKTIYWLTIDGEGGSSVDNSPLKIDSVHNAYMHEVIKKGSRNILKTEFYLIPDFLEKSIAEHQSKEK